MSDGRLPRRPRTLTELRVDMADYNLRRDRGDADAIDFAPLFTTEAMIELLDRLETIEGQVGRNGKEHP